MLWIVEENSVQVDAISGSTRTSNGIVGEVKAAIEAA
ncbi:FMN-binding protein [Bacillus sp. V3B]